MVAAGWILASGIDVGYIISSLGKPESGHLASQIESVAHCHSVRDCGHRSSALAAEGLDYRGRSTRGSKSLTLCT